MTLSAILKFCAQIEKLWYIPSDFLSAILKFCVQIEKLWYIPSDFLSAILIFCVQIEKLWYIPSYVFTLSRYYKVYYHYFYITVVNF